MDATRAGCMRFVRRRGRYARLVEQDVIATARQLENCLKIVRDRVEQMDGRIFQIIGDGVVARFNSAGSAVNRLSFGKRTSRA